MSLRTKILLAIYFPIAYMLCNILFSSNSIADYMQNKKIYTKKQKELNDLKAKQANLLTLLEKFENEDPDLMEELIKSKLNLCRNGEIKLKIESES